MIPDRHEWDQLYKLLLKANEYEAFIRELANWDATAESWYDLFKLYQAQAKKILRKP